ncbi:hypothetical protein KA529_03925 [Candidatus Saccharibacteria bacterium]|nr:hypothetical protein [Candidatus Saccharibacteria bacterium]
MSDQSFEDPKGDYELTPAMPVKNSLELQGVELALDHPDDAVGGAVGESVANKSPFEILATPEE